MEGASCGPACKVTQIAVGRHLHHHTTVPWENPQCRMEMKAEEQKRKGVNLERLRLKHWEIYWRVHDTMAAAQESGEGEVQDRSISLREKYSFTHTPQITFFCDNSSN